MTQDMTHRYDGAAVRSHARGPGYAAALAGWIVSVAVSVGLVLFLASPQGMDLPGNPFSRLTEPAGPKFAVAMKTVRPGEGGLKTGDQARASSETERALDPLRQALGTPKPAIARINALIALGNILRDYAARTKTYPSSQMKLVPAANALAILKNGEFEKNVPTSIINEMQYVSDGRSYKVIVLGSGDCAVVRALRPSMVDPKRSAGDLDCIAYGTWTPAGREF
ncbi:hypothetical protein ASD27_15160 [Mesorhizobium sp. Root1471]|uniref:hypothetical protein n=2 Tax=unclassified Mesorhizobium TaxID=325217 RepID=UPI0006FB47E6|nr:hypothetical protein [Mesorhizobium sp. Root554]KQZ15244.1 hypothetical protein ASD27_15160 [Mesorhizobium sp. Root1471]